MTDKRADPLGAGYWSADLSREQSYFCAVLKENYLPLREVLQQLEADASYRVKGSLKWEKLHILELMDVDRSNRADIYVRRGRLWHSWWSEKGIDVTSRQLDTQDLVEELRAIFPNGLNAR